jgi:cysteine desulfuration protein SufE
MICWQSGGLRRRRDGELGPELIQFSPAISLSIASDPIYGFGIERGTPMTIEEIRDNFALLEDWDDRYRYVIELGRMLDPMPESEHSASNKVQGCASQVWLSKRVDRRGINEPLLNYLGDSDAHIVRGLIAILLTLYSGHTPREILATDAIAVFDEFGFREHLTPQRSNGLRAMVERIRSDAREALAAAS